MAGKTIVITGGGSGIGRETVRSFALADATSIHILGRTQTSLVETKQIVEKELPHVTVSIHVADVTDVAAVEKAASEIGKWDVLVSNAAYLSNKSSVQQMDLADWWLGFEVNIKGSFIFAKSFLPSRNPNASIVAVSSAVVQFPQKEVAGWSSYTTSKLAIIKLFEFLAAEYPDVQTLTIHPGVVKTAMNEKSEMEGLPVDDVKLPAHFILWAASKEAAFAVGRFLWCNWDVTELKALTWKFQEDPSYLTAGVIGWP